MYVFMCVCMYVFIYVSNHFFMIPLVVQLLWYSREPYNGYLGNIHNNLWSVYVAHTNKMKVRFTVRHHLARTACLFQTHNCILAIILLAVCSLR